MTPRSDTPVFPMSAARRRHWVFGGLVATALALGGASIGARAIALTTATSSTEAASTSAAGAAMPAEVVGQFTGVSSIELPDGQAGTVNVIADPGAVTTTVSVVSGGAGSAVAGFTGGTLTLQAPCRCLYSITVVTGESTRVALNTDSGDLVASGSLGPLALSTGSGAIVVAGATEKLQLSTDSGDIRLSQVTGDVELSTESGRVTGSELQLHTWTSTAGSGDVQLAFTSSPASASVTTESGSVSVAVPDDAYRLDVDGGGSINVAVPSDPGAGRSLTVRTGSGDITITN